MLFRRRRNMTLVREMLNPPDPPVSLCPYCRRQVDNEATKCPHCGGLFPALRHREGEPVRGGLVGALRGIFMVTFAVTMGVFVQLVIPPVTVFEVLLLIGCVGALVVLSLVVRRWHKRAYHVAL